MDNALALTKALNTAGNIGYVLMAIGNIGILVCILTLGFSNQMVFGDTVWAVVLDAGAIYVTWRHYGRYSINMQTPVSGKEN